MKFADGPTCAGTGTTGIAGLLDRLADRFFTLPEAFGVHADPP